MPVDETILETKIAEYVVKSNLCNVKIRNFQGVIANLTSIRKTGENKDIDPKDKGTMKPMNTARRQEIFDDNIAYGDSLPE
jgi:hypothetical protein